MGYMPSLDGQGKISITLCTIDGFTDISINSDETPLHSGEQNQAASQCPYSLIGSPVLISPEGAILKSELSHNVIFDTDLFVSLGARPLSPYQSRAPPVVTL